MSSINTRFGQPTFTPTINTSNPGLAFGNGDDFLSPRTIANIGSSFVGSVTPSRSQNPYINYNQYPYNHNADASEILVRTTAYSQQSPYLSNDPVGIVNLPYMPEPYYQGVPEMGNNPNAMTVLSATTQFQNEIVTVGSGAIPGYPVINLGSNSQAIDYMGNTDAFINAMMPYQPNFPGGSGIMYPSPNGGIYYGAPQIQPPAPYYNPYQPTSYPHFAPYYGYGVIPAQIPYPTPNRNPNAFLQPQAANVSTSQVVNALRSNLMTLPDFIPVNTLAGAASFVSTFNQLTEGQRIELRQLLSNPTTVNEDILAQSGITSTGGLYNQGEVFNPFVQAGFLTDTNPFADFKTGMTVTNGNGNGKVKGTPKNDLLLGTVNRNNILDGQGGEDNIITSTKQDLVNVHQGDRVFTDAGDDLMFYDMSDADLSVTRQTVIDGGAGNDMMVITVSGNPSLAADIPLFTVLANGLVSVTHKGMQLLTRNIEKFLIVDEDGNIGSQYQTTTNTAS